MILYKLKVIQMLTMRGHKWIGDPLMNGKFITWNKKQPIVSRFNI